MDSIAIGLIFFGVGASIVIFILMTYPKKDKTLVIEGEKNNRIAMEKSLLKCANKEIVVFSRRGEWLTRKDGIPFLEEALNRMVNVSIGFSNHDIGDEILQIANKYSEGKGKGVLKLYQVPKSRIEGSEDHFWVVDSKIWLKEDEHDDIDLNERPYEYSFKTPEIAKSLFDLFKYLIGNRITNS